MTSVKRSYLCSRGLDICFAFANASRHMVLLCMLSPSVPLCEHSRNSNGGTLKEVLSCIGPVSYCIQNEFIDSPCCCSEHTLATNEEMTVFFVTFFFPDAASSLPTQ